MNVSMMRNQQQSVEVLRANFTRTLPDLGSGVHLFDAPAEVAGNSKLKIDLGNSIDLRA